MTQRHLLDDQLFLNLHARLRNFRFLDQPILLYRERWSINWIKCRIKVFGYSSRVVSCRLLAGHFTVKVGGPVQVLVQIEVVVSRHASCASQIVLMLGVSQLELVFDGVELNIEAV